MPALWHCSQTKTQPIRKKVFFSTKCTIELIYFVKKYSQKNWLNVHGATHPLLICCGWLAPCKHLQRYYELVVTDHHSLVKYYEATAGLVGVMDARIFC